MKTNISTNNINCPVFILIIGLIIVRFINLLKIPIFHDEAIYLWVAEDLHKNLADFMLPFKDGIAPLFIWIFGLGNIFIRNINQLFGGRVFMVSCDLISAFFIYLIARKLFSKNIAYISLISYLIIPLNFFHSRLILLESLSNMISLITIYFVLRIYFGEKFKKINISNYLLVSSLIILSYLAKPIVISGFITICIIPLLGVIQKGNFSLKKLLSTYFSFLPFAIIMVITVFTVNNAGHYYSTYLTNPNQSPIQLIAVFKQNIWRTIWWLQYYLTLPVIIAISIVAIYNLFKKNYLTLWLIIWMAAVVLTDAFFISHFYPRHLFLIAAPVSFLLGNIIYIIKNKFIYIPLLILILFPAIRLDINLILKPKNAAIALEDKQQFFEDYTSGVGLPEISADLKRISESKDIILLTGDEPLLVWALPKIYGVGNTQILPIKNYLGGETNFVPKFKTGQDYYLLLNKYPYPPKDWNLNLVSSYPKGPNRTINLYKINTANFRP